MRLLSLLLLYLAATLPIFGQATAPSPPTLPKDPAAILAAAAPFYDFNDPALKPWHLKATYQLYDANGKPTEQGTFEYWWASPKVYRISWTRPSAMRTEWSHADRSLYRKESGAPLLYFERSMVEVLVSPLPSRGPLSSGKLNLGLMTLPAGAAKLDCVTSSPLWQSDSKLQPKGPTALDYFCFEPSKPLLRLRASNSGTISELYDQIVKTQNHYLAREVTVSAGGKSILTVSVQTVDGLNTSDAALIPPEDAALVHAGVVDSTGKDEDVGVTGGSLIKKSSPIYPPAAKDARVQGIVILAAVIGTDGKIHNPEPIFSASPLLTDAAIDCVKQWEYKPYLLNGSPVEVDTMINVNFTLGR